MTRSEVECFFKTLILGDFEDNQSSSAQLVGGLISLIPILGQVMAARDITGTIFSISVKGGFKNASATQLVNLGFAAFGAIPEVGSVFKIIFKPMWRERQLAKGAVASGLHAIETMLGMAKGDAIGWIRHELLDKWASLTRQAIVAVNSGLQLCIALTEFLASAGGWQSWVVPASVQAMAKELLPGLKRLQGTINEPLQRASKEIREFLDDLLGEQVAAVVMAVGTTAAMASVVPGTRTRSGRNAADVHPRSGVPARQPQQMVANKNKADAHRGAGPVDTALRVTRKAIGGMLSQEKGLVGEHMVDYFELKRLHGSHPHDQHKGEAWAPATIKKLCKDNRPTNLSLEDLPKVNHPGIDAVWEHNGHYTVTEAKASASIAAVYALGKLKEKKGLIPVLKGLSAVNQELHYLLSDSSDKRGVETPLMQMGQEWIIDRGRKEGLPRVAIDAIEMKRCARRVVLVSLEANGAPEHVETLAQINGLRPAEPVLTHMEHGAIKEWEAAAIDVVEEARKAAHKAKQQAALPTTNQPPAKSSKGRRG